MITDPILQYSSRGERPPSSSRGFCYSTLTSRADDQGAVFRAWSFSPAKNSMQGFRLALALSHGAP